MRTVTNVKLAKRNRSIATYLFVATLIVLIGGFFFVNQSLFTEDTITGATLILQALTLPIAFLMTLFSIRMTNLWARNPRPDSILPEALKGLSKKSVLYNYYHLPTRHLLICPQGIFAIVTRWHEGKYAVKGNSWQTKANILSRLLSSLRMDGIGNPSAEAERAVKHAQSLLDKHVPNSGVQIKPLIVFLSPRAIVDIEDATIPVVFADSKQKPSLKDYMRDLNRDDKKHDLPLTDAQLAALEMATVRQ